MDETMVKIQKRNYKLPFFNEIIMIKSFGMKEIKVVFIDESMLIDVYPVQTLFEKDAQEIIITFRDHCLY